MAEPWIISDARVWPYIQRDDQRRAELLDWLRANGIDPYEIPCDSTLAIEEGDDGRIIRHTVYLHTADGRPYVDPANPAEAAQEERTVPLTVEPPTHWRPAAGEDGLTPYLKEEEDRGDDAGS